MCNAILLYKVLINISLLNLLKIKILYKSLIDVTQIKMLLLDKKNGKID